MTEISTRVSIDVVARRAASRLGREHGLDVAVIRSLGIGDGEQESAPAVEEAESLRRPAIGPSKRSLRQHIPHFLLLVSLCVPIKCTFKIRKSDDESRPSVQKTSLCEIMLHERPNAV
jgi:hypothetical protein